MPVHYDVAVVGGGTAGAVAAREAARAGARTVLIDAHQQAAQPSVCAGLVSPRTLGELEVSDDVVLRRIRGVFVRGPDETTLHLRSADVKAVVIDRLRVREELFNAAADVGVELLAPARCVSAEPGRLQLQVDGHHVELAARVLIGADGVPSTIARSFGLAPPAQLLPAQQVTMVSRLRAEDEVEVFVGRAVAPGFFAWSVPAEPGCVRIGVACEPPADPRALMEHLLRDIGHGDVLSSASGVIPLEPPPETVSDGVLLVGDAAGQVKPISGGGIYTGARCARIGGRIAGWAALAGRTTEDVLGEYARRWQCEIGEEIAVGLRVHRLRGDLRDEQLAILLRIIDDPSLLDIVAREADIDAPSQLLGAFLARRELWPRLLPLAGILGGSMGLADLAARLARPWHL